MPFRMGNVLWTVLWELLLVFSGHLAPLVSRQGTALLHGRDGAGWFALLSGDRHNDGNHRFALRPVDPRGSDSYTGSEEVRGSRPCMLHHHSSRRDHTG